MRDCIICSINVFRGVSIAELKNLKMEPRSKQFIETWSIDA